MLPACKDEDFNLIDPDIDTDGAVRVVANIRQVNDTRAYIADGDVKEGTFTLTYPYYISWDQVAYGTYRFLYHYGNVSFGYFGEEKTGFVNTGTATVPKTLKWSTTNTSTSLDDGIIVYPSSRLSPLYLDNFNYRPVLTSTNNPADTIVDLANYNDAIAGITSNPFRPGILDDINGTNDLLWGETRATNTNDLIKFDLYHRMTRFILNVVVDNTEEDPSTQTETLKIDLTNAKVKITRLLLEPKTYRRNYGLLSFQNKNNNATLNYEDYYLVFGEETEDDNNVPEEQKKHTWKVIPEDVGAPDATYTTEDFVFVPQEIRQGQELRAGIEILVPYEDVNGGVNPGYESHEGGYIAFRGNLPLTMKLKQEGSDDITRTLNFEPGQILTITTRMRPGEMELDFAPVTVEPWVWKGTYAPEAKQTGIFYARDFYAMIDYYNKGNTFWLKKYGFLPKNSEQWTIQFNNGNVALEILEIVGMMKPGVKVNDTYTTPEFMFDFRGRNQSYVMPDGTVIEMGTGGSPTLYAIVTAETNVGVENEAGFADLINKYQANRWEQFKYGKYVLYEADDDPDNEPQEPADQHAEPGKWKFKIADDISLDYNDIAASMIPPVAGDPNFEFVFDQDVTVSVTNVPDELGITAPITPQDLYKIVSTRVPGIYSAAEFNNVITALRNSQTGNLEIYGTETDGVWTFPLQRDLFFNSTSLQGMLFGRDNFKFEDNGHIVTFNQYDGTRTQVTMEDIKTVLTLHVPNGINDPAAFYALIDTYETETGASPEISYYGYYIAVANKWVFFFTEEMTLELEKIEKKMVPEDGRLEYSYSFNYKVVTVVDEETGESKEYFTTADQTLFYELTSGVTPEPVDP